MNELANMKPEDMSLEQLGGEIRLLTSQARTMVLAYGVEIGRRLAAAKEKVPYGQWGTWIATETEYSQSTAGRFIKLWEEYGAAQGSLFGAEVESSTLKKLSVSNALRLLAIPEEEREEFAIEVDAEHLSARELEEAIKARQAAEERAEKAAAEAAALKEEVAEADWQLDEARSRIKELESRPVEVAVQIDEKAVEKAAREAREAAEKAAKAAQEKLERELKEAKEKLTKAEAARDKAILESANAGEADKWKKEAQEAKAAAEAAERKLKAGGAAEVAMYCKIAQDNFWTAVEKMQGLDKDMAGKLGEGMKKILRSLLEKLG